MSLTRNRIEQRLVRIATPSVVLYQDIRELYLSEIQYTKTASGSLDGSHPDMTVYLLKERRKNKRKGARYIFLLMSQGRDTLEQRLGRIVRLSLCIVSGYQRMEYTKNASRSVNCQKLVPILIWHYICCD